MQSNAPIITTSPPEDLPHSTPQAEGVTTIDFSTNLHVIPVEADKPLMQSDQALLMKFHEQLRHWPFSHVKALAEQ